MERSCFDPLGTARDAAGIRLRCERLTAADAGRLTALFLSNVTYAKRVTGRSPRASDALAALADLPYATSPSQKFSLCLSARAEVLAYADVIRAWPTPGTAHIGLLMAHGAHHGRGLGRLMHETVLAHARRWPGITTMRIVILDANADLAAPFWRALGYRATGEEKPFDSDLVNTVGRVWERPLARPRLTTP